MVKKKNPIDWIAWLLVIIGALNWGLVGFFHFDLVATILGTASTGARIVYCLVGISAVYVALRCLACCGKCDSKDGK